MLRGLFVLGGIVALGVFAYQSGKVLAQREVSALRTRVETLSTRVGELQANNAELAKSTAAARAGQQHWRDLYARDVPEGPAKKLLGLVQKELNNGTEPERLATLIDAAGSEDRCARDPVTKRFVVRTPIYRGGADIASFAEDSVNVTAEGQSSSTAQGQPNAWFDPATEVTVTFASLGGKESTVSGRLPLHHTVVAQGAEYRFSIVPDNRRGFVSVTADRCALPPRNEAQANPR